MPFRVETEETATLETWDIVVIVCYFLFVMLIGLAASITSNRTSRGGYFLAGRSVPFFLVGASLFASNVGSGHFVGQAGSGAAGGIGVAAFELNAIYILMLLGWFFAPVYTASRVFTMPEYLRKRFGGQRIRVYLSCVALLLSIFTKISADLFAGATFIEQALGWNLYASTVALIFMAALFSILGGLTAVIWTDTIQTVIMVIGALTLSILSFKRVGGYEAVIYEFVHAVPNTTLKSDEMSCGLPPDNYMNMIRPINDPDLPWLGVMVGLSISSIWYWCSDQVIVQRTLASKNMHHTKGGCVTAGYLKVLPLFLWVMPGMVSRILFPDEVGCSDADTCEEVCGSRYGCTNIAYPKLVLEIMPEGLRGLMLAVIMAALMSSLTSIFNSSATIFTIDIWTRFRKKASEMEEMIVGRIFVIFMVVCSVLWMPVIQNSSDSRLFDYIQSVTSYLSPPVCALYVLGVFWPRTNEKGAFWGLMVGLIVGATWFILTLVYTGPECGDADTRPRIIANVHYLHFGIFLFGVVAITMIVISLLTPAIPEKHLYRLTFWTRHSRKERIDLVKHEHIDEQELVNDIEKETLKEAISVQWWKKIVNFACGIKTEEEKRQEPVLTKEEMNELRNPSVDPIAEETSWKWICNVNAIILMTATTFLWAFYA